ncbi:UPF0715 family protein [Bacillus sonorensis]|uniref:UPF0715 family protein n=1 Tax=Bacillus sonorensis TaxID=119858 RepID=UPI002DBD441A|nr:UPF0715 family protein [Bacillus sonorensis]MEC1437471.1 UPF0715 family protein [Bacillus sonorensis]
MKKMAGFTITILFSSLTLGLIQYLITGAFSQIYLLIVFPFYFFFPLLIFAIPLQYVLNKKPKKFSFVYFLFYLLVSSAANYLLFYLASIPGYPPLFARLEIYFYSVVAAITYWFWDSIVAQKKITEH